MKKNPLEKIADRFLLLALLAFTALSLCVLAGSACHIAVRAFQMGWRFSAQLLGGPGGTGHRPVVEGDAPATPRSPRNNPR